MHIIISQIIISTTEALAHMFKRAMLNDAELDMLTCECNSGFGKSHYTHLSSGGTLSMSHSERSLHCGDTQL